LDRIGVGRRLAAEVLPVGVQSEEKPATGSEQQPEKPQSEPEPEPEPTPEPESQPDPSPPPSEPDGGLKFAVHLASFAVQENADRTRARLKAAGVPVFSSEITVDGQLYHRVMVGGFASRDKAEAYGRQLRDSGLIDDLGEYQIQPYYAD
jgi:cell division septation protein DedD